MPKDTDTDFKFEVKKGNRTLMSTIYPSCVYEREIRDSMRERGYTLYKNGKVWTEKRGKPESD